VTYARLYHCTRAHRGLWGGGLRRLRLAGGILLTLRKSLGFRATLARVC
jgi:hypothetical protein